MAVLRIQRDHYATKKESRRPWGPWGKSEDQRPNLAKYRKWDYLNKMATSVVQSGGMKTDSRRPLAKGQIWKTRAADIEILALGESFIHYKVTARLGQRQVSAQLSGIEAMENYLRTNQARLLDRAPCN
jgi:hypothetical protein